MGNVLPKSDACQPSLLPNRILLLFKPQERKGNGSFPGDRQAIIRPACDSR